MTTYTIGQITDVIKGTNRVAKTTDSSHYIKHIHGAIHFTTKEGDPGERVPLSDWVLEKEWVLLPNFITFAEAIQAYKEGKTIGSYLNGIRCDTYNIERNYNNEILIQEILEDEWYIEED